MMDNETRSSLIAQAKTGEFFPAIPIPIHDAWEIRIGALYPISSIDAGIHDLASILAEWRQKHMRYFLTQFTATPERTLAWMRDVCVADNTRIMFLIREALADRLIGHVGARNIQDGKAELDNMIRGVKGGHADLMHYAVLALIDWLRNVLDVTRIYTGIFASNAPAIRFHERVGLRVLCTIAAEKTMVPTPDGQGTEIAYALHERSPEGEERGYVIMERALE